MPDASYRNRATCRIKSPAPDAFPFPDASKNLIHLAQLFQAARHVYQAPDVMLTLLHAVSLDEDTFVCLRSLSLPHFTQEISKHRAEFVWCDDNGNRIAGDRRALTADAATLHIMKISHTMLHSLTPAQFLALLQMVSEFRCDHISFNIYVALATSYMERNSSAFSLSHIERIMEYMFKLEYVLPSAESLMRQLCLTLQLPTIEQLKEMDPEMERMKTNGHTIDASPASNVNDYQALLEQPLTDIIRLLDRYQPPEDSDSMPMQHKSNYTLAHYLTNVFILRAPLSYEREKVDSFTLYPASEVIARVLCDFYTRLLSASFSKPTTSTSSSSSSFSTLSFPSDVAVSVSPPRLSLSSYIDAYGHHASVCGIIIFMRHMIRLSWCLVLLGQESAGYARRFLAQLFRWFEAGTEIDPESGDIIARQMILREPWRRTMMMNGAGPGIPVPEHILSNLHQISIALLLHERHCRLNGHAPAAPTTFNLSPHYRHQLWHRRRDVQSRDDVKLSTFESAVFKLLTQPDGKFAFNLRLDMTARQFNHEKWRMGLGESVRQHRYGTSDSSSSSSAASNTSTDIDLYIEHPTSIGYVLDGVIVPHDLSSTMFQHSSSPLDLPSSALSSSSSSSFHTSTPPSGFLALELDGPHHYCHTSRRHVTAHSHLRCRQIRDAGWNLIILPVRTWNSLMDEEKEIWFQQRLPIQWLKRNRMKMKMEMVKAQSRPAQSHELKLNKPPADSSLPPSNLSSDDQLPLTSRWYHV